MIRLLLSYRHRGKLAYGKREIPDQSIERNTIMKQVVIYAAVAGSVLAGSAQAQFHNKARETGQVTISQQAQANMVAQQKAKIARGVA